MWSHSFALPFPGRVPGSCARTAQYNVQHGQADEREANLPRGDGEHTLSTGSCGREGRELGRIRSRTEAALSLMLRSSSAFISEAVGRSIARQE